MFRFYDVVLNVLGNYEDKDYFMDSAAAVRFAVERARKSKLPCGRYVIREVDLTPNNYTIRFFAEIRIEDYIGSPRKRRTM